MLLDPDWTVSGADGADGTPMAVLNRVHVGATQLEPQTLRALDAIHVSPALRVRPAFAAFVSYDRRQLAAAEALGLPIASPR